MAKGLINTDDTKGLIHIPIYYKLKQNKYGVKICDILTEKQYKEAMDKNEEVDVLNTKWKNYVWQTNSQIMKSSTSYNPQDGSDKIDRVKYHEQILKTCLDSWDAVDQNGDPVPLTMENIGKLPMVVGQTMISRYDEAISVSDPEEIKK